MARRKAQEQSSVPAWLVTFADLMSLLVVFFVLIISFSIQDREKLQVVAGSMREAFGVKDTARKSGLIELDGVPTRDFVRQVAPYATPEDTDFADERHDERRKQGPEVTTHDFELANVESARQFAAAAASLRQSLQDMPEIANMADQIIIEETPEGLNIQLLDKDGRSMFAPGSKNPNDHTRRILEAIAPLLKSLPNRIAITGHTDSARMYDRPGYTQWELTADRANAARAIMAENGIPSDRFHSVVGKADTDPLFPDNSFLAGNRRISILVMSEDPPLPVDHRP